MINKESKAELSFSDVWHFYPNIVDYFRLALSVAATFGLSRKPAGKNQGGNPSTRLYVTTTLLLTAFLLDIVDGELARAFHQSTLIGDGIDWIVDLYIDVLLMIWWIGLEPNLQPWIILATMAEIGAAIFDFAITATDRYPRRGKQDGFCVVLEWTIPGGRYSTLGYIMWMCYPFFIAIRCLELSHLTKPSSHIRAAYKTVLIVLALPAAICVWSNAALLVSGINRWTERRTYTT